MAKNVRFIQKRFRKSVHTYKPMMFRKHLQFSKNISDIFHIFGVRKRHIFKMLMHYHWQFKFIEIRPYIQSCNVPKRLQFSTNFSDIMKLSILTLLFLLATDLSSAKHLQKDCTIVVIADTIDRSRRGDVGP